MRSTERPAGEAVPGPDEGAGTEGARSSPGDKLPEGGDEQAPRRDGGHAGRAADPDGRQALPGAGDRCLQEAAGTRGKQVNH